MAISCRVSRVRTANDSSSQTRSSFLTRDPRGLMKMIVVVPSTAS